MQKELLLNNDWTKKPENGGKPPINIQIAHLAEVYKSTEPPPDYCSFGSDDGSRADPTFLFTTKETREPTGKLRSNAASGNLLISVKTWCTLQEYLPESFVQLYNDPLRKRHQTPEDWSKRPLTAIPKNNMAALVPNQPRPIAVSNVPSKLFSYLSYLKLPH